MNVYAGEALRRKCAIIMPAYNEEEALPEVIREWVGAAAKVDGTLVVLNDGSKDNTLAILKESMRTHDNLIVIDKPNSGHGPTCLAGYRWATEQGFEWVFQTDSDGQTKSEEFLDAWKLTEHHDFIFGFRPTRGDGFGRWVISRVLRLTILMIFGVAVRDANVPFRIMRASKLPPFLDRIPKDLFLANAYLAVLIRKSPEKIRWVTISFSPRTGGVPSVSWRRFAAVGLRVIRDFRALREQ